MRAGPAAASEVAAVRGWRHAASPATSMEMMARADVDDLAGLGEQRDDRPVVRARELDGRLRRLDVDERLVERDRVADGDLPRDDLGLGQALADVGEVELALGHVGLELERSVERVEQAVDVREVVLLDAARRVRRVVAADAQRRRD